ncbi:hypothetical protein M0805_006066 [Coniferiporia weirii]|nr:hypothetical protein M0805_006066 [Coniferiporia weirii]
MGIVVSWINAIWATQDAWLSTTQDALSHHRPSLQQSHSFDALRSPDVDQLPGDSLPLTPTHSISSHPLTPVTPPSPSHPLPSPSPSHYSPPHSADRNSHLLSTYDDSAHPAAMTAAESIPAAGNGNSADPGPDPGTAPRRTPLVSILDPAPAPAPIPIPVPAPAPIAISTIESPAAPLNLGLRINVSAANDPAMDREIEMVDASFVTPPTASDPSADMCFDDDGLSALEKIYLFARSNASFHREFIARSLPMFLPDVAPSEAVEYVIPLMNGLAMDEDEAVKEALVEDLVSSIWWFLTHCQVVSYEVPEEAEPRDVPLLYVQSFTPLLGTLLLNPSINVGAPARHCVVNLLGRIREADGKNEKAGDFVSEDRRLFERELIQQVVIGMAHLDANNSNDESTDSGGRTNGIQTSLSESAISDRTAHSLVASDALQSPPPSAADDSMVLSAFTSAALALATTQFLAEQDEPSPPRVAALAARIQRPPSPLPSASSQVPILSEIEPEFAHLVSQASPTAEPSDPLGLTSPMEDVRPSPGWNPGPFQAAEVVDEHVMSDASQLQLETPQPLYLSEFRAPTIAGGSLQSHLNGGGGDLGGDFNDEQAAIGRLASMSLMAAVTASGYLDPDSQLAFVKEVERAGRDVVFWVRREATFALGALAKVVPEEILYLTLLPLFESFCEDSAWNVRQSVLFALPAVLSRLPFESRRTRALHTILKLSVDPEPQVRTGVLEVLGEVIYSFDEDDKGPPDEIVRLFIGEEGQDWHAPESHAFEMLNNAQSRTPWGSSAMRAQILAASDEFIAQTPYPRTSSPPPSTSSPVIDAARPLICAFNLPAVVLTLGPGRWSELRGLYFFLARTGVSKVRQTLAASIGEVARIIGPENARHDLIYRWLDFARGHDAAVRAKALEALDVFLQALDPADRAQLVDNLEEIWVNHLKRWREREVLAKRLSQLAHLFPTTGQSLRTLFGRALRDETAAVRKAAVDIYPYVYDCLSAHPELLQSIVDEVLSLANEQTYKRRLTYVECVKSLITHYPYNERIMDDESFWHPAVALAKDKIVDVRIGMARLMNVATDKIVSQDRTLPTVVLHIVQVLSEDKANDVRAFVLHILARDTYDVPQGREEQITAASSATAIYSQPPPRRQTRWPQAAATEPEFADSFPLFIVCNAVICTVGAWNLSSVQELSRVGQFNFVLHLLLFRRSHQYVFSPLPPAHADSFLIFLGALGLVVVFPVIFIEVMRKGAITGRVWFEVGWITLFWLLNFAGAAAFTAIAPGALCSFSSPDSHRSGPACTSARILVVFSWLNTGFLFLYFFLLSLFAIMHRKEEDGGVWQTSVREFPWFETKQCLRSTPNSPVGARFVKTKLPSLVAPKPRRPPPVFVHQRAGLSSAVEIEHFTDIASAEEQPLPPNPTVVAPTASNALSFYPQHVQTTMQVTTTTYGSNTYYPSNPGPSPPPIRNWPLPMPSSGYSTPRSERAAQKQRANSSASTAANSRKSRRSEAHPLPQEPEHSTARNVPSRAADVPPATLSPTRSRPTGPRTRSGSSGFVRPRPPPLDLTLNGSTPNVRR